MDIKDAGKQLLGVLAPTIGTAILGPIGGVAGKILADKLGVDKAELDTVLANPSPEQVVAIKNAETEFQKFCMAHDIDVERLHQQDRADARKRQTDNPDDKTTTHLAWLYTIGFFAALAAQFAIVFSEIQIQPNAMRMLDATTGVLFALMMGPKEYYFGSSSSSKLKTWLSNK